MFHLYVHLHIRIIFILGGLDCIPQDEEKQTITNYLLISVILNAFLFCWKYLLYIGCTYYLVTLVKELCFYFVLYLIFHVCVTCNNSSVILCVDMLRIKHCVAIYCRVRSVGVFMRLKYEQKY